MDKYIIPKWKNIKYINERFKLILTIKKTKNKKVDIETIEWTINEVRDKIRNRLNEWWDVEAISQEKIPILQNNPNYEPRKKAVD